MKILHSFFYLALLLQWPLTLSHAEDHQDAPSLDAAGFDALMEEISNWGRWGAG